MKMNGWLCFSRKVLQKSLNDKNFINKKFICCNLPGLNLNGLSSLMAPGGSRQSIWASWQSGKLGRGDSFVLRQNRVQ
jgi:hypothetical protein